jgi:hypothetical protein
MEQGTHPQQEILTCHFQFKVFFGIKQQKLYRITYISTKLEGYRHLHLHELLQHPHTPNITQVFFGTKQPKQLYRIPYISTTLEGTGTYIYIKKISTLFIFYQYQCHN